jgi:para-nitrobenzyl esterase
LRFIREHAACFGGDPDNICLMGQSAGGNSIAALFAGGHATTGVRRAILQSAALGMPPQEASDAARLGANFVRALGANSSDVDQVRAAAVAAPVETILAAQAAVARQNARYGDTAPPFQLVRGAEELPSGVPFHRAAADTMDGVDVLIGVTADEAEAFFALDPRTRELDDDKVVALVHDLYGEQGIAQLGSLRSRLAGAAPAKLFSQLVSQAVFAAPARDFAERRVARGGSVHFYDFAWQPGGGALGSCHCLELPFVFGPTDAWQGAPMLATAATREIADLSAAMRSAWLAFVRTGRPNSPDLPEWRPFTPERPSAMRLARQSQLCDMQLGS